jgi:GNAT superfamily N-acetyltransferase
MDSKQVVMNYFAKRYNLEANVFDNEENVYLESDSELFRMITFGKAMIFLGRRDLIEWARDNFVETLSQDIIDAGNLYKIECKLRDHDLQLAGEHLRFLYRGKEKIICPDDVILKKIDSIDMNEFQLRYPGFINAFNYEKDEIAIAASVNGNIAAIAGADNYNEPLWHIGIDTVKEYRRKGLAKLVIQELTKDILKLGKIPYYTTWSANLASMKTALSAGFYPEWIEYFAEKE